MDFFERAWEAMCAMADPPRMYGWYHILCWSLVLVIAALLCFLYKKGIIKSVYPTIVITAVIVLVLEIYKMIVIGYFLGDWTEYVFPWRSFPWQFCSMPMYIGLLVGVTRGKLRDALCCFLATYAVFAGTAVMIYPGDVFVELAGVNIQTMVCHGSMLTIGIFLYYTNSVKAELKTLLKAVPVFVCCLLSAIALNEYVYSKGWAGDASFNMFYVSQYEEGYLPVYRVVQSTVPYPWCLFFYIGGFTLAALIVLSVAMGIKAIARVVKRKKEQRRAQKKSLG
jgi:hypothetical protein